MTQQYPTRTPTEKVNAFIQAIITAHKLKDGKLDVKRHGNTYTWDMIKDLRYRRYMNAHAEIWTLLECPRLYKALMKLRLI